ncbi:Cob(I)yrinic acid a,c-diamide adenosyltransferase [bioreactor metagenome]|uniref:Cob(I)yrinic acid a,c-diamide adenosyltransferase n=1 Tax=bioreactor metagenome TaxID=1076179 RepID=A0A645EDI0_9ZZZZ
MKIYTKTGDKGTTALFSGERVEKFNGRINLYGTVDELIAVITLALEFEPPTKLKNDLEYINQILFYMCTDFATVVSSKQNDKIKRISEEDIRILETIIDEYTAMLPELKHLIVPGGNKCSAFINQARTICRRAERIAVELATKEELNPNAVKYLNRLSDYLFTAMRYANFILNCTEKEMKLPK